MGLFHIAKRESPQTLSQFPLCLSSQLKKPLSSAPCLQWDGPRGTTPESLELLLSRAAFGSDASKNNKAMAPGVPILLSWRLLRLKMLSSEQVGALHPLWRCGSSNSVPPALAAKCNQHKMICSKQAPSLFPNVFIFCHFKNAFFELTLALTFLSWFFIVYLMITSLDQDNETLSLLIFERVSHKMHLMELRGYLKLFSK